MLILLPRVCSGVLALALTLAFSTGHAQDNFKLPLPPTFDLPNVESDSRVVQYHLSLSQLEEDLQAFITATNSANHKATEWEADGQQLEERGRKLSEERSTLEEQRKLLNTQLEDWQAQVDERELLLDEARYAIIRLDTEIASYENDRARWDARRITYNTRLEELTTEQKQYDASVDEFNQDIAVYQTEFAKFQQSAEYFDSLPAHQRSQADYNSLIAWKQDLENRAVPLQQRRYQLEIWVADLRNRDTSMADRGEELVGERTRLEERYSEIETQQQAVEQQALANDELKQRIDELGEAIDTTEAALAKSEDKVASELADLEADIEAWEAHKIVIDAEVQALRERQIDLVARRDALQNDYDLLKSDLEAPESHAF